MSIRKLHPISRKALALTLAALMSAAPSAHLAHAQDLDDAIDAELDEVAEGDMPSTEPDSGKTAAQSEADDLDDVQLDDGEATSTADAPTNEIPKADDTSLDELDEPATATAEAPKTDDSVIDDTLAGDDLDVELDGDDSSSKPAVVEQTPPADDIPMDDLEVEDSKPAVAEAPPMKRRPVTIDAPNEAYEQKLTKISKGYKQVPDVNWDEIVGDRRQENYGIQRGDTLWDISDTFFGDGFFWAKLWSQNGVIGNPHMIVRGKAIRFVAGTEGDAPAIGVMDTLVATNQEIVAINPLRETVNERPTYREQAAKDITAEEVESGVVLETDELIPAPELPPPSKRVPLLKELPGSFRPPVQAQLAEEYDASGVKGAPEIRARMPATGLLNSMIFDREPKALGKTDEIESQERVAHVGQTVFVRLNREVAAGTKITFGRLRPRPAGASGPVLDIQGVGVIGETINEGRNAYRVTVVNSIQPIEKNSTVYEFAPPKFTYTKDGRRNESEITVVGGEFDDRRKLVGAGSVVYLAGGKNVGLRVGDIMGVEAVRGERRPKTAYPKVKTPIALIKIADVQEKVATAVVLVSTQPIVIGDRTGGAIPESLPSLRSEAADAVRQGFSMNETIPEAPAAPAPSKLEPTESEEIDSDLQLDAPSDSQMDVPPADDGQMSDDLDATLDE